ncbi:ABC transporter substrate-binding protein [Candidatus Contendibacter odensensis]|uniref:ABC-type branched-chain amino acid transport systems, periplasmic component n=1 Tax=Candidatus Contendobacter odensis Run_B_J11 TaxID=1400861 RepID=A0A7U7J4M3_9GAMM|nr:ABC transporter substrate-binding protein [Candidatus Contendobacter odensis]MBK8753898.1 ABC transporter substrate-binding protein [Candidatus Competibacteraceae bacterium]CDH46415.1 ABC-type branched-chain amino acid transport systems, periplasmic component [Candidatus Contendobacter odensis Run_B_J11]
MKDYGWKIILAAALLAITSLAGAVEPIRIGSFLSVTGPASFLGDPELRTLQMVVKDINAKGGVKGRPLELIHYDTGGNAREALSFVKRLIQNDKVDLIIGGTTSGDSLAVIPEVEKAGIPFISLAGAVDIIEPVKKWVFKVAHTDRMAAAKIFEDLRKRGLTKVALITGDGGFDKSGREQLLKLAPEYGITFVADESYGNKDTDMTPQLTKIRSSDAEAIINFGFGQAPAIVTKNMKQLGINLPLYQSHGVASQTFIDLAGAAAEGVRLPAAALVVAEQLPSSDLQKPVLLAYKKQYEAQYGPVSTFGGHAYDGLMIAVAAMERAGDADKAKVRTEIEKTQGFIGTAGVFNMNPTDHMGLNLDAFKMVEVRNGAWKIVE